MRVALHAVLAALGHGPALLGTIQRHIDRDMIFRMTLTALVCTSVIRRKNATYKRDNGQAVVTAVGERVDVPPEICTRREWLVESR